MTDQVGTGTPRTKRQFYDAVVEELNLDVSDPITNIIAHACALVDQRDDLRRQLSEAHDELANWRKVTAKPTPDDCAAGIEVLHNNWQREMARANEAQSALEQEKAARVEAERQVAQRTNSNRELIQQRDRLAEALTEFVRLEDETTVGICVSESATSELVVALHTARALLAPTPKEPSNG